MPPRALTPEPPNMTPDPLTKPQREAVQKAWDILTEHFDRVLLVVDSEVYEPDGKREDAHEGFWHGGSLSAVGMAEFAKHRILNSGHGQYDPGDVEET